MAGRAQRGGATGPADFAGNTPQAGHATALDIAESAEISFTATVAARELHFTDVPHVVVTFPDDNDSASGSVRTNLPYDVAGGETYRDIRVAYALASRIDPNYGHADEDPRHGAAAPDDDPPSRAASDE